MRFSACASAADGTSASKNRTMAARTMSMSLSDHPYYSAQRQAVVSVEYHRVIKGVPVQLQPSIPCQTSCFCPRRTLGYGGKRYYKRSSLLAKLSGVGRNSRTHAALRPSQSSNDNTG